MSEPARRRWILPMLIAPFALWAVSRLFFHDAVLPLVWASSVTPWGFAPVYLLLVVALLRRRDACAAVAGFVVVCHLSWVGPTMAVTPSVIPDDAPALRVVTANLLGVNERPDALLGELLALDADVLVLEEVSPRWATRLTDEAVTQQLPYRDIFVREDSFGIAILARRPLTRSEVIDLEGVPMIDATVDVEGRAVRLLAVHTLPPVDRGYAAVWRRQLARLRAHVQTIEGPLVMAGDLNATSHAAGLVALRRAGLRDAHDELGRGLATTWPNGLFSLPPLRLDHVLVGRDVHPVAAFEGRGEGSDHRPVIVDLRIAT